MEPIREYLAYVKVGRKQAYLNMTLFPLLAPDNGEPEYLTLDEALEREQIEVTEVSSSGSVPELKLINRGKQQVLIVEGEELHGAKQNRIVNSTFLVDGSCELVIPVSCVEQGRWGYRSERFRSGGQMMPPSLKRAHQQAVRTSLRRDQGFRSDQNTLWEQISAKGERLHTESATGAMADIYQKEEPRLSEYERAFRLTDAQVGAVFGVNGKILGAECFGFKHTFAGFFKKLIRSYALDAIDWFEQESPSKATAEKARAFMESVGTADTEVRNSLALGHDFRLESDFLTGAALAFNEKVLHLSVFKKESSGNSGKGHYDRFSDRRSRRAQ